ncbi:unnamed protein product [Aspergillus oryzae]|uniref:Unnamed protein product n=2 Tax=Aspergillus oryzae TaxID=5062 RepID=A0AAN5BQL9_ASPOZ|nr:unnamed protein product [Aspergillus oryzae]GMF86159.1 unnamed protein product [Aspergillus oryzae]GMG02449.1 unnamed protein product [Aspergillus oryzae]GMG22435.1 unnamed protein product [Aspergillus oryzae]GMG53288.1 unnamed protein product [Aspergillus oryzae var. brunneus]
MGISIVCYWIVVPFPEDANFLTPEEKALLLARLEADGGGVRNDPISFKRPTILKDLGWTARSAQAHGIPIYAVAFVLTLSSAWLSDHLRHRFLFTLFGSVLIIIGWSVQLAHYLPAGVRYMGMFFVASGAFIMMSITVVWLCVNLGKGVKRSVGMGLLPAFGNCGAFVSGNVFITSQSPKYPVGFGVGLGFAVMAGVASTVYYFGLRAENRRRDSQPEKEWTPESAQDLGDAHPDFRSHRGGSFPLGTDRITKLKTTTHAGAPAHKTVLDVQHGSSPVDSDTMNHVQPPTQVQMWIISGVCSGRVGYDQCAKNRNLLPVKILVINHHGPILPEDHVCRDQRYQPSTELEVILGSRLAGPAAWFPCE